ncbi:MAG TPA: substrate-binding domain-containing protein [Streptosporangiaceae bacterium]|jgi:simple sugar transport system substrate-binding protein|nr:substrate-binding domain-containing protein [Streptosporangiaceae bacterium]
MKIDPKVEEAVETLNMKDGPTRRRLLSGAGLVSASAAAAGLLAACSSSAPASSAAKGAAGNFPKTPAWQFWYVNHVTTNPFFVPTQYGFQDAAALLDLPTPKWGGSQNSLASEMVSYFNTAISAKAAGIAYAGIDATSFTTPVKNAMNAGIPVLSYNADGLVKKGVPVIGTNRLAYVGQALYISGQQLGNQIKSLVPGGGDIAIFIATPGSGNIQPRYDGAVSVLGSSYTVHEVATGAATGQELSAEKAFLTGHKTLKGAFAVDAGSTQNLAQALGSTGLTIPNGGFDTTPTTLSNIEAGKTNFTIYQDPYMQGFLPTLYFYLYNISGGTVTPADTDTGLTFITKSNAKPFTVSSRFQGSTSAQKYQPRPSGAISNPTATTST